MNTPSIGPNSFALIAGETSHGNSQLQDVISADSNTFVNGTKLIDVNPYDQDELIIVATKDVVDTPIVSGIETITFTTSAASFNGDSEFDINLLNVSGANLIKFENSNSASSITTLDLSNVTSPLTIGSHFTNVKIGAQNGTDVIISNLNDIVVKTTGNSKNLSIDANGKNVTILSSTNTDDITINNANIVDLKTILATDDLKVIANGNFSLFNGNRIEGNIDITSGGTINITNATKASGTLSLSNERALPGNDIIVGNVDSFGKASIKSAGSITATTNNGLASAKVISATAAEDSIIHADGVDNQLITLSSENTLGETVQYTLNASTLSQLNLTGSSPIVVNIDGADISNETVTNTNSDATILLSGSSTNLRKLLHQ